MWPYNVQATAALDISSSVCLAIKYQSPATKKERKNNCSFRWNLPARDRRVGGRNRHSPGQPRRATLLEGTLVTEQKVGRVKGLGQSFRQTRKFM